VLHSLQDDMSDPIAFLARTSDPDTMYFHQAIWQPPKGMKILDSVWAMKRKRDFVTREVYKHKAS
jgi:hypothetical protein